MANWAMYTPWPFSDLFRELGDTVQVFDFDKHNFVTPIIRRRCMVGCLKAFAKSGFQRTFYDLGRVGYRGPQSKGKVDFHFDAARTAPRAAAVASAEDDGRVTMHRGKIEHKAKLEARAAESATAMACGGGREQLADDDPRAAG